MHAYHREQLRVPLVQAHDDEQGMALRPMYEMQVVRMQQLWEQQGEALGQTELSEVNQFQVQLQDIQSMEQDNQP